MNTEKLKLEFNGIIREEQTLCELMLALFAAYDRVRNEPENSPTNSSPTRQPERPVNPGTGWRWLEKQEIYLMPGDEAWEDGKFVPAIPAGRLHETTFIRRRTPTQVCRFCGSRGFTHEQKPIGFNVLCGDGFCIMGPTRKTIGEACDAWDEMNRK